MLPLECASKGVVGLASWLNYGMPFFVTKREWDAQALALAKAEGRVKELERQNLHLLNCALTKNNNYAIPQPAPTVPVVVEAAKPVELIQGYAKDDFIAFEVESGYSRADAEEMWER